MALDNKYLEIMFQDQDALKAPETTRRLKSNLSDIKKDGTISSWRRQAERLAERAAGFAQKYDNDINIYGNQSAGISGMTLYKKCIDQLLTDMKGIGGFLRCLEHNTDLSYSNAINAIAKAAYIPISENEERQTLETLGIGNSDPIKDYQVLHKAIIDDYGLKMLKTALNPLEYVLFDGLLETPPVEIRSMSIKGTDGHDNEAKTFFTKYIAFLKGISKDDLEDMMHEYSDLMGSIYSRLNDPDRTCVSFSLANINTEIRRHLPSFRKLTVDHDYIYRKDLDYAGKIKLEAKKEVFSIYESDSHIDDIMSAVLGFHKNVREGFIDTVDTLTIRSSKEGYVAKPMPREDVDLEYLVGVEDNIRQLDMLIESFLTGEDVRAVCMRGPPGVGKSWTAKGLLGKKDVKVISAESGNFHTDIQDMLDMFSKKPYPVIIYLDNYQVRGIHSNFSTNWEDVSKALDGFKAFPDNIMFLMTTNESFKTGFFRGLLGKPPKNVVDRIHFIDYQFDYRKHKKELVETLCRKHGMDFEPDLIKRIEKATQNKGLRRFYRKNEFRSPRRIEMALKNIKLEQKYRQKS